MPGRKQPVGREFRDPAADEVADRMNDAAVIASDIGESLTDDGQAAAGAEWKALATELQIFLARARQLAR